MQPEIDLLGLPIKTFGLMFALGFIASGAVIHRRMKELHVPADWAYEMIFAALIGGLVGSRLFWIIENPDRVHGIGDLVGGTGLVWYGGVLGGALFVVLWARWRGWLGLTMFDVAAVRRQFPALARDRTTAAMLNEPLYHVFVNIAPNPA